MNEMTACNLTEAAYSQVTAAFWIFLVTQKDFRKKKADKHFPGEHFTVCLCCRRVEGKFFIPSRLTKQVSSLG